MYEQEKDKCDGNQREIERRNSVQPAMATTITKDTSTTMAAIAKIMERMWKMVSKTSIKEKNNTHC